MDIGQEPHSMVLLLDEPLEVEDGHQDSMLLELFTHETGLVPEGKGIVKADPVGSYEYWKALSQNRESYKGEKDAIAQRVIDVLEGRFPGLKESLELVEVTTPVTCERYTGNFHGYQPWPSQVDQRKVMKEGLCKTLPGLDGLFLVGQWTLASVGVSTTAISGRDTVEQICRMDRREFVTERK